MHLDHLDDSRKLFNLGAAYSGPPSSRRFQVSAPGSALMIPRESITLQMVVDEIAKCEAVCANCHATRGHNRSKAHQEGRCECPR
jgi:hypothetical protein